MKQTEKRQKAAEYIRQWRGMVWDVDYPNRPRAYRILRDAGRRIYKVEGKPMTPAQYEKRVRELEAEGLTRSDAQGVADAEAMQEQDDD